MNFKLFSYLFLIVLCILAVVYDQMKNKFPMGYRAGYEQASQIYSKMRRIGLSKNELKEKLLEEEDLPSEPNESTATFENGYYVGLLDGINEITPKH
jgi:hypothetical protein